MKEINLIEEQIARLDTKDFDFKAWKQSSVIILSRIFGEDDQKVKQMSKLEMDYSSWSLRDTSGNLSQIGTLKRLGREILQVAIDELKTFGLPENKFSERESISIKTILAALENELKISQFKELQSVINSDVSVETRKTEIMKLLRGYGNEAILNMLVNILSADEVKGKFDL